jgi:hypothetical protein
MRYQCSRCHEITQRSEPVSFCAICAGPLTAANVLPEEKPVERGPSLADLLAMRDAYSARV